MNGLFITATAVVVVQASSNQPPAIRNWDLRIFIRELQNFGKRTNYFLSLL